MSFAADYRRDASVNVNAIATAQQAGIVCGEATRERLIALREKLTLAERGANAQPDAGKSCRTSALPVTPSGKSKRDRALQDDLGTSIGLSLT